MRTSRRLAIVALPLALACGIGFAGRGAETERKLAKAEVPASVLEAFQKAWPKAKAVSFAREEEDGKTFFEIESREGTTGRDILVAADGAVVEVEETMKTSELPAPVLDAVKALGKGVTIRKAEKVSKGAEVTYAVGLKGAKVKAMTFDAAGKPVGK